MKISKNEINKIISSNTTTVFSYPQTTHQLSVVKISVNGRHPVVPNKYFIEQDLCVIFYILEGQGNIMINKETFTVNPEDLIEIRQGKKYYIEGNLTYLAITSPAYYKEQNQIVD